jgi:glutamate dehydrogenase (NAD(P)+)
MGAKVLAVSDVFGALYNPAGLDIPSLVKHIADRRPVAEFAGGEAITNSELLLLPCDVLVPAAMENQITADNAPFIRAKMIVEGANGPVTSEADVVLTERGITVVPDILANAGGVLVSYFEWVQDISQLFWTLSQVNNTLDEKMRQSYARVADTSRRLGVDLRTAALALGVGRAADALRVRGIYP